MVPSKSDCFLLAFVFFCCVSCNDAQQKNETKTIPYSILESAQMVKGDILHIAASHPDIKDIVLVNPSTIMLVNSSKCSHFLDIVDLETGRVIDSILYKGNGPGESLSCEVTSNEGKLLIHDYIKRTISITESDGILHNAKPLEFESYSSGSAVPYIISYSSDTLVALNPYCFRNASLNINTRSPRLIMFEKGGQIDIDTSVKYDTFNVSQGFLIASKRHNRIMYFSLYYPEIETYDGNGRFLSRIIGPIDIEPNYVIEGKDVSFKGSVPYAYLGVSSDEDYIYATFLGKKVRSKNELYESDSYICTARAK